MTRSTVTNAELESLKTTAMMAQATEFDKGKLITVEPATLERIVAELLALREAQSVPVAWITKPTFEDNDGTAIVFMTSANLTGCIPLFTAPPAPEGFNKLNIRAAAQLRAAMRDQWLKAEDFADKIYWQNLHNIANEIVVALMAPTPTKAVPDA